MLIPVILSGGAGTRLWPVSREAHPKPFMRLPDGESLLQKAFRRALGVGEGHVLTVTHQDHLFKTRDEFAAIAPQARLECLLEPCRRNTAPAIALAALHVQRTLGGEHTLLVLPADHLIEPQETFEKAVGDAGRLAQAGYLVTFGIPPAYPETGFGYIEAGEPFGDIPAYRVEAFREKPDEAAARRYAASGRHFWNAGMFCFRADAFLETLAQVAPEIHEGVSRCLGEDLEILPEAFARLPDISVDYAVMEKADRLAVIEAPLTWSDIGSWRALSELLPADKEGNRLSGEVMALDCHNTHIQSEDRVVAAIGLEDLVVVDTPDALLIAKKDKAQEVKAVVEALKERGHEAHITHRTAHRPWGTYTVLEEGERFKIKRIVVRPGASLSLQMHHHRSEHWIVVSGTAKVVNDREERLVRTNESTFIPAGTPHRLMNPGVIDLVMIEVQSGEYLGEDDIVRFEDIYGRS